MSVLAALWYCSGYYCLLIILGFLPVSPAQLANHTLSTTALLTEDDLIILLRNYHRLANITHANERQLSRFMAKKMDMFSNFSADVFPFEEPVNELTLSFRIIATTMHLAIFLLGVSGNALLVVVAHKSNFLKQPMYTYLVSMAYADLLVCLTAIPEAIVTYHLGNQWFLGQVGCSVFIFLNFFGINAGVTSMSMMTFERYVAICRPLLARKVCTVERTRKIIICSWVAAAVYCSPWLGLTEVKPIEGTDRQICDFRLSQAYYMIIFGADLLLFYFTPLLAAVVIYVRIDETLRKREAAIGVSINTADDWKFSRESTIRHKDQQESKKSLLPNTGSTITVSNGHSSASSGTESTLTQRKQIRARIQVVRMLFATVLVFAIAWLPFRGLLMYNTFAATPWLNEWYSLFAKTLIYLNSAINPVLYNIMSARFRRAFYQTITCKKVRRSSKKANGNDGTRTTSVAYL
ncbi:thyrotropin-releasing hormone receptor-like isoform X1 [Paramacrobiotus metropolitanus]|uniref:thyrotropin-releasing hormone receptor-like isoform X1 n=1 Tax=Paramacrobiotus metropolitanus TaxID=2943436 RepID=UPI002445CC7D|nr:thyrotropin-releasing hormone receptor-like isoform X1 [Paramacrobiotus metropolitanus]